MSSFLGASPFIMDSIIYGKWAPARYRQRFGFSPDGSKVTLMGFQMFCYIPDHPPARLAAVKTLKGLQESLLGPGTNGHNNG